jgi:hypothetical protein
MALKYYRKQAAWNYWSNSRFSKWLRTKAGLDNPTALSFEGWDEYEKDCKQRAPFTYWLTDTAFDKLQNVVYFIPNLFYSVGVFYKNWKCNSHVLSGNLPVGEWCDLSNRIPVCLFTSLERFIEDEKGLDTLAWELSDDLKEDCLWQHEAALEQKAIYEWWKVNKDRDTFVDSGLQDYYYSKIEKGENLFSHIGDPEWKELSAKQSQMEKQFKTEEEDMLIRLIKIRNTLWS